MPSLEGLILSFAPDPSLCPDGASAFGCSQVSLGHRTQLCVSAVCQGTHKLPNVSRTADGPRSLFALKTTYAINGSLEEQLPHLTGLGS